MKPKWIIDERGTAHYFRRWAADINAETWCGRTIKPLFAPAPLNGRECRVCTDDTREQRERAA